jgi:ubiquinone/menaquinone biosynthesis C-methylase UbiE
MEANFQYVPIAPDVVPLIASLVSPAPPAARMADICAGTGAAAAGVAEAWQISRDRLYLNELVDGRKAQCAQFSTRFRCKSQEVIRKR